ncbi:hypothetical protein OI25_7701 [Paraburkholderia fungorum]|jgi:hypothetical protein|uniref:Uncharacterized protein n=1 Tax=Paraburkholderia fungorum TaxID=134537 RepID=A0AAU8T8U2_9BURK|nr:hypothetical protein OI25_7701 [Paraburkholderia fungorum]PRZ45544.1 hypothetical protein BX589_13859 [Paraburkholderia fungorum]
MHVTVLSHELEELTSNRSALPPHGSCTLSYQVASVTVPLSGSGRIERLAEWLIRGDV